MSKRTVGYVNKTVIELLNLSTTINSSIYIGDTNIDHMKSKHPKDYEKYGKYIQYILACPDYVGQNPTDGSIEYVKQFVIDNKYVKVAVRVTTNGTYYARSLYVLNSNRVNNFIKKGSLHKIWHL